MAGTGGTSRRSHTKSRKGCKTCKRRHIRCDETFPQCRNCTKHQVRCDYMETVGSDTESQASPEQPPLVFTPNTENRIDLWQQTGSFPYPDLQVFPYPQTQDYSKDELRLMHHLLSISNDLTLKGSVNLTLWTEKLPKFLSLASSYPYVMHALLSFSANHLAWARTSTEIRNVHIQHGTIALRGLHEAIGSFSHGNADAVLAASLLLLWQATDWRSWSSLRAGIQSVLSAMQSWKHESIFAEYIAEEELAGSFRLHRRTASLEPTDRSVVLQNTIFALQRLQLALSGNELESHWINQLLAYLQRLHSSTPAQTPDEQFSHLYLLRKWLFWVPVALLERQGGQGPAMLTLAHFYSTALALEPLFPDLGSSFCAKIALGPLEAIIGVTDAMQNERAMDQTSVEIASLMQFPRQTVMNFRGKHSASSFLPEHSFPSLAPEALNYTTIGNLSPAFAPSPLHYATGHTQRSPSQSSFLEVPITQQSGFTYGTQSWGAIPSPGFPPSTYTAEDDLYGYGDMPPLGGFRSGFVQPATIWT